MKKGTLTTLAFCAQLFVIWLTLVLANAFLIYIEVFGILTGTLVLLGVMIISQLIFSVLLARSVQQLWYVWLSIFNSIGILLIIIGYMLLLRPFLTVIFE